MKLRERQDGLEIHYDVEGRKWTLDTSTRTLHSNRMNHQFSENSTLTLMRHRIKSHRQGRFKSQGSSVQSSDTVTLLTEWTIQDDHDGVSSIFIRNSTTDEKEFWVASLAESLAEALQLTLIDATGLEPVTRPYGTTDYTLQEYLYNKETPPVSSFTLPKTIISYYPPEGYTLQINSTIKGFAIALLVIWLVLAYPVYLIGADVANTYNFGAPPYVGGIVFVLLVLLFVLSGINYGYPDNSFTMAHDSIIMTAHYKIFGKRSKKLHLSHFEFIIATKLWDGYTVEFVGDKVRLPVPGIYTQQEAVDLKNLLESAIRDYCL